MIERKIRVGMMLNFPLPTFAGYVATGNYLQPVPSLFCHVWRTGFFSDTRGVTTGVSHRGGHRNFAWLPFRPGYTTYNPLDTCDVLSGPFSGCRMLLCEVNGVRQVYHVGTQNGPLTVESLRAKRAMYAHLIDPDVVFITGFSPFSNFNPMPAALPGESPIPRILGLITETGECFTILMRLQTGTTNWRVVAVEDGQTFDAAAALLFFNV